jgi:hypothetical protein
MFPSPLSSVEYDENESAKREARIIRGEKKTVISARKRNESWNSK